MQQVSRKHTTPTTTGHYVPRNGKVVKLPWSALTEAERKSLQQANDRATYVQQFSIYSW